MDSIMGSQMFTQNNQSQAKKSGVGTEKFINALIALSKNMSSIDKMSEKGRNSVVQNFRLLQDETKWKRMCVVLLEICLIDRGKKLFEFSHAWFFAIRLLPDEKIIEEYASRMIKVFIDVMMTRDVSIPNFFGIYNDVNIELEEMSEEGLMSIVEQFAVKLNENGNEEKDDENKENYSGKRFNQRWKDLVLLVLKRIGQMKKISYKNQELSGEELVKQILFDWLKVTKDENAFGLLIDISNILPFTSKIVAEKFCDEEVAENIIIDKENSDEDDEKLRKIETTWKGIILTSKVDKDRANRLWNGILRAWEIDADKDQKVYNDDGTLKCLEIGCKVLNGSLEAARIFLTVIKNEKYRVLSSEIGFGLAILHCNLDRNSCMQEMKKMLQKLWKIGEQAEDCHWMSEFVCGDLLKIVDNQLREIGKKMGENKIIKQLFAKPLFGLMLSLLDTPAHQKQVVIIDGRVADGCSLWLLSRDILIMTCQAQQNMSTQLTHLFTVIASSSSNNSALILIDVLKELVKKCSVEILNNSKLIDGLFDYVCRMRRDIAVSLIRCLLPIINTRPQLRSSLFKCLKKDMLCESTVSSAIPIVLMLMKSVSKRKKEGGGGQFDHSMSQSFGSFSTQTLNNMGYKKNVDQNVALELIGIINRCLSQPSTTKIILYDGICELATQTTSMLNQFLDMMLGHAENIPEWSVHHLVKSVNRTMLFLTEPLPHLIQTIECLMSELSHFDPSFEQDGTEVLLKKAVDQMDKWVTMATRMDVSDMGLDANADYSTTTVIGRSNILFGNMMISVYDVLIEHIWRRIEALDRKEDSDKLVGLLNRRKELHSVIKDKMSKKEDGKSKETFDYISQTEILTSSKTISSIFSKLLSSDSDGNNSGNNTTLNVRSEILEDVQFDLISWAISRTKLLSSSIIKEYRPLHSIVAGTSSLSSLAKNLWKFYIGNGFAKWIEDIEQGTLIKTWAIESYANILQFLTVKYRMTPLKVAMMWFDEKEGEDEESRKKRTEPNVLVLKHANSLCSGLFKQVIHVENDDIESGKKSKMHYEAQGRAILRATTAALSLTKHVKVYTNLFKRVVKVLEKEEFYNNQMLRDYCKFVTFCALRCGDSGDLEVIKVMISIFENVLELLSEEGDVDYGCIKKTTINVVIDFILQFVEKSMLLIREAFGFLKDFCVKPQVFDEMLGNLLTKCVEITEMVTRILQLFVQYKMMQEKVVETMTNYFSVLQLAVVLLQNQSKGWNEEKKDWKSVRILADLVKNKLKHLLAMVDDHIGFSIGKEEMKKKLSQRSRYQKSRRDEKLYVKYSHEREALQHSILVLCVIMKDDRFDLQVKNNSIGYRDFRIDMKLIRKKLGNDVNDESRESRKRRRNETDESDGENEEEQEEEEEEADENEIEVEHIVERGTNEKRREIVEVKEEPRSSQISITQVKQEVEEPIEINDPRSESPEY